MSMPPIGYRLRSFPDGFEARIVHEPNGNCSHWILLRPLDWIVPELNRLGLHEVKPRKLRKSRAR